jgi:uncharacterized membrane protein YdjX (TVP38/TMEM64 family)
MSKAALRRFALALVILALVASLLLQDSIRELLSELVTWVRQLGVTGALVYGLVYVAATVALLPGALLTLGAGFLYGPGWGSLVVLVFSVLGASASFLLARSWWRPWFSRKFSTRASFQSLDQRIQSEGWKIVFLLRLSPLVPFSMLNYLLGLTSVSLRGYVAASIVGMVPGILLYSYLGSLMATLGDFNSLSGDALGLQRLAFWGGMVATLVVSIVLTRWARERLGDLSPTPAES